MPNSCPYLLSCDWGTSSFRLRLVARADGRVLAEIRSDDGVKSIAQFHPESGAARSDAFRQLLTRNIGTLCEQAGLQCAGIPVIISGMASASIGWQELPYAPLPIGLDGHGLHTASLGEVTVPHLGSFPVTLISGIAAPCDVMRGEETQLLGLLRHPEYVRYAGGCLLILPGTHSKHVVIRHGQIIDFTTYLTGELFAVLGRQSILVHSLEMDTPPPINAAFDDGVKAGAHAPLGRVLFQVRTRQLLHGSTPTDNTAFFCGVLIGSELSGIMNEVTPETPILLAAGTRMADNYARGCTLLGMGQRCIVIPPEQVELSAVLGHLVIEH